MASSTVFVYIESAADVPLTGASPTLTYWDKATPGAPAVSGAAMTELQGGAGGIYFADVVTADGKEYAGQIDCTAGAAAGTRYRLVSFSGTSNARLETDIPAIHRRLGLDSSNPVVHKNADDGDPGYVRAPADGSLLDLAVTKSGAYVTVTRQ